ncbi:MAG: pantetheine-phosphate adenylyltransferase [Gemmatimonadota bacterium]|nr:pantetheine-phosphate adenylyltransferase [Gemmatimonadota bacterium]
MKTALYPGTFDPITNGHLDIIHQALGVFDQIIVTVAPNLNKSPLFSLDERIGMINDTIEKLNRVTAESFHGLIVDAARRLEAVALIRGVRTGPDFESEYQMSLMNRHLAPEVTTVCFLPGEPYTFVSSSLVREVAQYGGNVDRFVPDHVSRRLKGIFTSVNPE